MPENRANPEGRKIHLKLAMVHSDAAVTDPDPNRSPVVWYRSMPSVYAFRNGLVNGHRREMTLKPVHIGTAALSVLALLGTTMALANPPSGGDAAAGAAIYQQNCVGCHGDDGRGQVPGTPDFTQAGGVLSLSDKVLEDRIIHGFQSDGSPMAMPPKGGDSALTPADVDNVIAYLRKTFGH